MLIYLAGNHILTECAAAFVPPQLVKGESIKLPPFAKRNQR